MQTLIEKLNSISPAPLDCIIHVGAGRDAERADYNALQPNHLLIIEADPEASECLRDRFKFDETVTVIPELVGTSKNEIDFHRYTLPTFNGPLGLGRLGEIYPRIKEVESIQLRPRGLTDILQEQESHLGNCNLLILDTPGQELSILSALPSEWLPKFSFIILTGCSESWMEGSGALAKSMTALKEASFEMVSEKVEDPAWPQILMRQDEAKAEIKSELDNRVRLCEEKAILIHQQGERIGELERGLAELSAHRDALQGDVAEVTQQRDELQNAKDGLNAELELRARLLEENSIQIHQQGERIGELESALAGLSAHRDALQGDVAEVTRQRDELQNAKDSLHEELENRARLLVEKDNQIHQQGERYRELEKQVSDLLAQLESLIAERDLLNGELQTERVRLLEIDSEKSSLLSLFEESSKRLEIIDQELIKKDKKTELMDQEVHQMEGQLNLIRDLLFISEHKGT